MEIEHLKSYLSQVKGYLQSGEQTIMINPIDEVIECLEEGEKYKKMWGELNEKQGWRFYIQDSIHNIFLHDLMNKLNQKYFPEPKSNLVRLLKELDKAVKEIWEEI